MIVLWLPYPPSANRLWRNLSGRTVKSEAYRRYLSACKVAVMAQRAAHVSGRFHVTIIADRPDARRRDLDNLVKPSLDALMACGVIEDDSSAEQILMRWSPREPVNDPILTITIWPASLAQEVAA